MLVGWEPCFPSSQACPYLMGGFRDPYVPRSWDTPDGSLMLGLTWMWQQSSGLQLGSDCSPNKQIGPHEQRRLYSLQCHRETQGFGRVHQWPAAGHTSGCSKRAQARDFWWWELSPRLHRAQRESSFKHLTNPTNSTGREVRSGFLLLQASGPERSELWRQFMWINCRVLLLHRIGQCNYWHETCVICNDQGVFCCLNMRKVMGPALIQARGQGKSSPTEQVSRQGLNRFLLPFQVTCYSRISNFLTENA